MPKPVEDSEEQEYLELLEQEDRERLSPKLEAARITDKPIVIAQGGRGAGAKSWSFASLVIQLCQYGSHRVACLREVQLTLQESVYQLIVDTIDRLGYSADWHITLDRITNVRNGSFFIFRGLRDIRAASQIKGLEGFDIVWVDEASAVIDESWSVLMPTIVRNDGWRLFISYNPETDFDPCTVRFWNSDRDDVLRIRLEAGKADNPWWNDGLTKEMEQLYRNNPDEAEHVFGGQPRKQGIKSVFSRVAIRGAMSRVVQPVGAVEIGIDPAWFGDDETTIFRRKGLVCTASDWRKFIGMDPFRAAAIAWEMAGKRVDVEFKVDGSPSGWAIMAELKRLGAKKVFRIDFGGVPQDKDKYTTAADEMWFEFPMDEAQIPNDNDLMIQLSGRQYDYDKSSRKKIEPKDKYKDRFKKSPDRADGLLLCYYRGGKLLVDDDTRNEMAARRKRGR